jgi:hypothetical protein
MGDPRCLMSVRDVITLAADAYDQPLVPQCRERMRGGAVRNPVFLGKAQDRGHAASQLPGGDLVANQIGELLVQRNRRLMVEHEPQPTSPVSARVRWGLPVRTRAYTEMWSQRIDKQLAIRYKAFLPLNLPFATSTTGTMPYRWPCRTFSRGRSQRRRTPVELARFSEKWRSGL